VAPNVESPVPERLTESRSRAVVLYVGLFRMALGVWLGFRPFDDTYITFRYALNLAAGRGFVFNDGEPVLGTTTPLWTLLLSCAAWIGAPLEYTALGVSLLADVGTALIVFQLLRRLGYSNTAAMAAGLLFLSVFDFLSLARSGMEASVFVLIVLAALERIAAGRLAQAGVACGLASVTRPEGLVLMFVLAVAVWRARRQARRSEVVLAMVGPIALVASWAIYAVGFFGTIVPQSVLAKAALADPALTRFSWTNLALFFLRGQFGGEILERTYLQLMPAITLLATLGAYGLMMALARREEGSFDRVLLLLVFPTAYIGALAVSGAFTFFPWYYAPAYPFLAVMAIIGADRLGTIVRRRTVVPLCGILVLAQVVAAVYVKLPNDRSFWIEGYRRVSAAVDRDPNVTVAALEIGTVGWYVWPARVLDLVGLVSPEAVGRRPFELIQATGPDYLIVRSDDGAGLLREALADTWFSTHYTSVALEADPFVPREFRAFRRLPADD